MNVIMASAPKLVMFGASMFLFPEPIKEIREQVDPDIKFVNDAAHIFCLVYSQVLQEPFKEGVDLITSNTHKTFKGPQGVHHYRELGAVREGQGGCHGLQGAVPGHPLMLPFGMISAYMREYFPLTS